VGSYPEGASPYGALDMVGNVWEWVADWYYDNYYSYSPLINPMGPESGTERILRGGSWDTPIQFLSVSNRTNQNPATLRYLKGVSPLRKVGFRCVMDEGDDETQTEPRTEQTTIDTSGVSKVVNSSFIEPILAYIDNRSPDVEDDFSVESPNWQSYDIKSTKGYINNELRIEDGGFLNLRTDFLVDFVLEIDFRPDNGGFSGVYAPGFMKFSISSNGQWELKGDGYYFSYYNYYSSGFVQSSANYQLQVLLKGTQIVFIVNKEPIIYIDHEPWEIEGRPPLNSYLWSDGVGFFDNFKYWDISQFELPFDL
jgi:hypothetical protein